MHTLLKPYNNQGYGTKSTQTCDLLHDVAPGSNKTPCNKIDKPLVAYRFSGNVMTSIITWRKIQYKVVTPKMQLLSFSMSCDK